MPNDYRDHPAYAGKKGNLPPDVGQFGITPAYAGKSIHALLCACRLGSPRVCGKRAPFQKCLLWVGITPAYAGKRAARSQADPPQDHPRVCGESYTQLFLATTADHPRVCGERGSCVPMTGNAWDHPRVCGEKPAYIHGLVLLVGSPPRMRGKVSAFRSASVAVGITPAYAGKRCAAISTMKPAWDHPRVCGEKFIGHMQHRGELGSPPRMRGKACIYYCACLPPRITPAYAGKRRASQMSLRAERDHPRVCGEKGSLVRLSLCGWGSPPRMRGKGPKGARP